MHTDEAITLTYGSGRVRWAIDRGSKGLEVMDPLDLNATKATSLQLEWLRLWARDANNTSSIAEARFCNGGGS